MTRKPDYYALLGVLRDATSQEIKRAYFEAAQRLHPDKNKAPDETEFFLEIQQAYEVLSDPKKRVEYDALLPPEDDIDSPIQSRTLFSRQNLVHLEEPQLVYALLEWNSRQGKNPFPHPPLNVCLILDRSTSMKGTKLDMVKAAACQLIRSLRQADIFGVVGFSDQAEALIPSGYQSDKGKMEARIYMMTTSGATEMYQGLKAGILEVERNLSPKRINHVILLTDGHTYGDEHACLVLAVDAAKKGIGISSLGIGLDWNDTFLDAVANCTGGSSMYVSEPEDIKRLLAEKYNHLGRIFAEEAILEFECSPGVELTYAFRMHPEPVPLTNKSPFHLGPILHDISLDILLEFQVQPSTLQSQSVQLLDGRLHVNIPSRLTPIQPMRVRLSRPVMDVSDTEPPPAAIVQALSYLNLYRMQEKAQADLEAGKYNDASRRLQNLATHLLAQGERSLARSALLEAENIQQKQIFSKEGRKQIKYGTRALLMPGDGGQVS